ncbi:MAG: hypothetical protein AAGE85_10625 [Pseudomonadota bacterium]
MFNNTTLIISGPDTFEFLQAQLTSDLNNIEADRPPQLSAWCNPKGRVITLFRIRRAKDCWHLALPGALADTVSERLTMYRFRSKVDIERGAATADDLGVAEPLAETDWRRQLVTAGVPYIDAAQSGLFTPHMLNLDRLGAVHFDKGCYPGQEIVARIHFRGASKRRLRRFSSATPHADGDKLQIAGRDVGEVVNAVGNELLAVVPVDGSDFAIGGESLTAEPLPYDTAGAA